MLFRVSIEDQNAVSRADEKIMAETHTSDSRDSWDGKLAYFSLCLMAPLLSRTFTGTCLV